jgi:autotransporter-associated beta strand protein
LAVLGLIAVQPVHAAITWNVAGGGNWDTTTANWTGDSTTFTDDGTVNVIFDKTNGGTITISANMTPASTTVSAASGTYTFSGGPIDSGSLTKSGGGTLVLSSANTFTGATNISGGTLRVDNLSALSGTSAISLSSGARLETNVAGFNLAKLNTANGGSGVVAGSILRINQKGAMNSPGTIFGTLEWGNDDWNNFVPDFGQGAIINTLSTSKSWQANMTFSGDTTIDSGPNQFNGNNNQFYASTSGLKTLTLTGAQKVILSGIADGAGQMRVVWNNSNTSANANQFNNASTFTGGTTILQGTVFSANATGVGPAYAASITFGPNPTNAQFYFSNNTTLIGLNTDPTNPGTPVVAPNNSAKTLTINNPVANTYAGTLTNTGAAGTGTLAITKGDAGTLTLSGATRSYTGLTTVSGGTLLWSGANNLAGNLTVNAGGNFSLADGTARTTTTTAKLTLASGANLAFDWTASGVDTLTSTAVAATVAGNVGIIINPSSPDAGGTLISSSLGGLNTATYFLANNTNYTATLTPGANALSIGSYAAATPLTSAYWLGNQVPGAVGSMALSRSDGTLASNWASDAAGTSAGGVVPGSSTNVFFSTTTGATQQSAVTLGANMTVNSVTFNDNTAVTIAGSNYLTLMSAGTGASSAISVSSTSAATTTISSKVALGANQTWTVASGKTLAVSGEVSGGGNSLTTAGIGNLNVTGVISGLGTSVTAGGTGTLTLGTANTYTGKTVINSGTLAVTGGDTTTVGGAAPFGAYPGGFQADNITINNGGTLFANFSGNVTQVNRGITLGSGTAGILMKSGQNEYFYGVIGGTGNLSITAGGNSSRAWFYAPMTYSGTTTNNANSGTMGFGNASSASYDGSLVNSPSLSLSCSAVWQNIGNTTYAGVISGAGSNNQIGGSPPDGLGNAAVALGDGYNASIQTAARGTLTLTGANTYTVGTVINSGGITLAGNGTLGNNANALWIGYGVLDLGGKSITQNGGVTLTDGTLKNGTLTSTGGFKLNSAGTNGGFVVSANLAGSTTLTKSNAGTATLSGTNTYTGTTTVSGGVLLATKPAALPNYDSSAKVIFNGGTVGVRVGGGGSDWTTGQVDTLLSNATKTSGALGIDTSNASSGLTQWTPFTTTNFGSTLGLTKLGINTLTLDQANTYTGATTVSAGTLVLSGNNSGSSSAPTVASGATLRATAANSLPTGLISLRNGMLDLRSDSSTSFTGPSSVGVPNSYIGVLNVDRAVGGTGSNQTLSFPLISIGASTTMYVTGDHGYSLTSSYQNADGNNNYLTSYVNLNLTSLTAAKLLPLTAPGGVTVTATTTNFAAGFQKNGYGILTLAGATTLTGAPSFTGGQVNFNGTSSGAGAVGVSAGAIGGTGSISSAVTVSSTGGINLVNGSIGNLTLGSTLGITGAAGANNLKFDLSSAGTTTDKILVTGATSVTNAGAAVINLNQIGGVATPITPGTYTLIQGTGAMAVIGKFALATSQAFGQSFSLGVSGNNLQVTTAAGTTGPAGPGWAGSTALWATAGNWSGAAIPGYQSNVAFNTAAGTLSTTLNQDFDINSLTYGTSATAATTIAKGTAGLLTIEADSANGNTAGNGITVNTPSSGTPTQTISANVGLARSQSWTVNSGAILSVGGVISDFGAGLSLTKEGAGTLILTAASTYTGGTIVNGGTLRLSTVANTIPGSLTINSNGKVEYNFAGALSGDNWAGRAITIDGGTLDDITTGTTNHDYSLSSVTMHGGTWSMTGSPTTGYVNLKGDFRPDMNITTLASANVATINANLALNSTIKPVITFETAANNTGVDLLLNGKLLAGSSPAYGITKAGPGVMAITSANNTSTYTGVTTIDGGTLQLGNGGATGSIGSSSAILNNGTLAFNRTDTLTQGTDFASVISGAGAVTQAGTGGTTILTGANTYTGPTTISAGTLQLTGSGAIGFSPVINVASGAFFDVSTVTGGYTLGASQTLKGNGTVIGPMTAAGTVAPGSSTGVLSVTGNATLNGTFSVDVETGGASDLLAVSGNLALGPASILNVVDTLQLNLAKSPYTIATYGGSLTGTFGGGNNLPLGTKWTVDYGTGSNSAIKVVPEPATLVLLGLGGIGLILSRKRK